LFTVHGITSMPCRCDLRIRRVGDDREVQRDDLRASLVGDDPRHGAVDASAGMRMPAGPRRAGKIVARAPSATRRRRGSSSRARSRACASRRTAAGPVDRMVRADDVEDLPGERDGSTVSFGAVGSIFVSMSNWTLRAP
jgi:hypothetical protein